MKIAIVIPVFNRRDTTLNCLHLLKTKVLIPENSAINIIVVDDGSTDGTAAAIKQKYSDVTILTGNGNLWWTGAINMGVEFALSQDYDYVLTLNDDMEFDHDFLTELCLVADKNPQALVSSLKLNKQPDGKKIIMIAGIFAKGCLQQPRTIHAGESIDDVSIDDVIECDMLTGAALLIPTEVFNKIGIFDSLNFPHNWADFEFTRRASLANFKCLVATNSRIYTDYNQNYAIPFLLASTKMQYLKSLLNNTRYYHGFISIYKASYMHQNILIGTIVFAKELIKLTKNIALKMTLPNSLLRTLYK